MSQTAIHPAFHDRPRESQAVFRAVMGAMARPGLIVALGVRFEPPAPLSAAATAILLTLADFETPVWLDGALSHGAGCTAFLRFHTGARIVADPASAAFALIGDPARMPPLSAFAQGTPDYPDRSATLILQVSDLKPEGWRLAGPGIKGETLFSASPLSDGFPRQLQDNHARFPLGLDLIFSGAGQVAALPRSTQVTEAR
jgi:alpha-D-ribose 1-methylphosphonate 5-triphosphate synthase subunit PhnH